MPFLGIEIGGTKLQLVLGDKNARITARRRLTVEPARGAKGIRTQIEQSLPALLQDQKLRGVGVGFGGPVNWESGKICRSHQIEGWSNFDLGGWLRKLTGAPVAVDNDANVAALGEARHGAGIGFDPAFYVTLGSGVGGGLVSCGQIYHGATPGEAEIGHIRLDRKGATIESRCSGWSVDARVREVIKTKPQSLLAKLATRETNLRRSAVSVAHGTPEASSGGEAKLLPFALKKGDSVARRVVAELSEDLAFGLSHAVHLFHPQVIILGGGLSKIGRPLRATVAQKLPAFVMEAFLPAPQLRLADLGEDAVPIGALALALGT